jgi:2-oxo-4-hydroxy-4-carboxy-5-ureidoimidazoline decarboxylase
MLDIQTISAMDRGDFIAAIGPVFEHSPWIAERAWEARPFADLAALHAALAAAITAASPAEQLALLNAHPELAGRAARAGEITAESRGEQGRAGLDQLTEAELAQFDELNRDYRARFGFPFIIAVHGRGKTEILQAFERRLSCDPGSEVATAFGQVAEIGRLRLERLLTAPGDG